MNADPAAVFPSRARAGAPIMAGAPIQFEERHNDHVT